MNVLKKGVYGLIKKLKFLPKEFYLKIYYEYYTGKKLDLKDPKDFNEKIQWLKAFYHPPILNTLVDKIAVHEYVREKIGAEYLNPIIGVYDSYEAIDFESLPEQFVIKGSHGSNYNYIVKNKGEMDHRKAKRLIKKWLGRNYYYSGGLEWAYKNVPPRILIEGFMIDALHKELLDYKFYCFHGQAKFVQIDLGRPHDHTRKYFNMDWKEMSMTKGKVPRHSSAVDRPKNLSEMKELAFKLAKDFPFARVDFYSVNGNSIFGEITFYPGDGRIDFKPERYNRIIGDYMTLPKIPEGQSVITKI
jgi:hypothetical protein